MKLEKNNPLNFFDQKIVNIWKTLILRRFYGIIKEVKKRIISPFLNGCKVAEHHKNNFVAFCLFYLVETMNEKERRKERLLTMALDENGLNNKGMIDTPKQSYKVEEVEKVDNNEITTQEIINRIEDLKERFESENGVTNWKKESPSMFQAFCLRCGVEVFDKGRKNLLKVNQTPSSSPSREFYDIEKLEGIYQYYSYLCSINDVPIRVFDFCHFVGINPQVMYDKSQKLTSSLRGFLAKIQHDNEYTLESVGIGGKRNSLVIMASLNHRHGWNKEQVQEQTEQKALVVQELPKLNG